jgi:glycosyltransferase involved in cell wall biosynthesis
MKVACVIPAYNVKEHLPTVVAELQNLVDEIVVVNDCSTDGTGELAKTLPVNLLHHSINRGQGAALKTGTQYALDYQRVGALSGPRLVQREQHHPMGDLPA